MPRKLDDDDPRVIYRSLTLPELHTFGEMFLADVHHPDARIAAFCRARLALVDAEIRRRRHRQEPAP